MRLLCVLDVAYTGDVPNVDTIFFSASELEPLFDEKSSRDEKPEEFNTEYKKKFRPFSEVYTEGKISVNKKSSSNKDEPDGSSSSFVNGDHNNDSWYREVVELRKKAVEYRVSIIHSVLMFPHIYISLINRARRLYWPQRELSEDS